MGLLDNLLFNQDGYGGQQGGLLGLLQGAAAQNGAYQPNAGFPQQQQPFIPSGRSFDDATFNSRTYAPQAQPIGIGNYMMPRVGPASDFQPQPQQQPQQQQPQTAQASPTDVSAQSRTDIPQQPLPPALGGNAMGGNFGAGLQNFASTPGGLIGKILGGVTGFATGQRTDPIGVQQQNLNAQFQATRQALIDSGMSAAQAHSAALLSVLNPKANEKIMDQQYGADNWEVKQTGENGLGAKTYQMFNKKTGEFRDIPQSGNVAGGGIGDMSKSGAEYFATLPKQVQGTVQGMLDGTIQPPSSFAAAKPYWQGMLAAAKNVDPTFDENKWASRHKMATDVAASGNSSMGGILSNGKSAFKHLAEYTESAADLGNASHNFPGGGIAAHAQNYIGNTFGGSDTNAKIKAINDNLGHYGQESTKFYAGTGGGVEERMNALKEMNPVTTSSAEMAAYAQKEKSLMLDRLREKEAQIRDTMGEAYLQQHPVFTDELKRDIARIDANVAKLNSGQAGNVTKSGVKWSVVP